MIAATIPLVTRDRAGAALETLSRRLLTAQEDERRRVAAELRDELGQMVSIVKIELQSLERSLGPAAPELEGTIGLVDQVLEKVRDLALDLRPSVLDDLGLSAALRWYADRLAEATQLVEVHVAVEKVARLGPELETACFRVAQAALTNALEHAGARNVWLGLRTRRAEMELVVRDDGAGFDVPLVWQTAITGTSLGLLGMRERVALLDGALEIESSPARGTEVRARFPLKGRPSKESTMEPKPGHRGGSA